MRIISSKKEEPLIDNFHSPFKSNKRVVSLLRKQSLIRLFSIYKFNSRMIIQALHTLSVIPLTEQFSNQ